MPFEYENETTDTPQSDSVSEQKTERYVSDTEKKVRDGEKVVFPMPQKAQRAVRYYEQELALADEE